MIPSVQSNLLFILDLVVVLDHYLSVVKVYFVNSLFNFNFTGIVFWQLAHSEVVEVLYG